MIGLYRKHFPPVRSARRGSVRKKKMDKLEILRLIESQLRSYGLETAADGIVQEIKDSNAVDSDDVTATNRQEASNRLASLIDSSRDKSSEIQSAPKEQETEPSINDEINEETQEPSDVNDLYGAFLDDLSKSTNVAKKPEYRILFTTIHKFPVLTCAFSWDGNYVATGSVDTSLKVLDVEKMRMRAAIGGEIDEFKPTIRTLYDHTEKVNEVSFHPGTRILASCSADKTIKFFDLQRVTTKKAFHQLGDACEIRSISFHPSGDFLLSGTTDTPIRLYDLKQNRCLSNSNSNDSHDFGITRVRWNIDGRLYVSSSEDGSVKIWDSSTGKPVKNIKKAHSGREVTSVQFSKNSRYLLTNGKDSSPKIWDLSQLSRPAVSFSGSTQKNLSIQACFNSTESLVLSGCEKTNGIMLWCSRTGKLLEKFSGHNSCVRGISSSPLDDGFISFGDDCKARYWNTPESLEI